MINIICALKCEANPLVRLMKLKKSKLTHPFPIFSSEQVTLIISGVGKLNAVAACAYLHGLQSQENRDQDKTLSAWLNVGVAGHRTASIGSGYLVLKVIDEDSKHCWYPVWLAKMPCSAETVVTVSKPDTVYKYQSLVDMEAAAVVGIVSRFTTMEFVHCYKIVSDNKSSNADPLEANEVEFLVAQKGKQIIEIVEYLTQLVVQESSASRLPEQFSAVINRYQFSVTQKIQLKRNLYRWQALSKKPVLSVIPLEHYDSAKEFLKVINAKLLDLSKAGF